MSVLDELESCYSLFLVGICEAFEGELQILLQEAGVHKDKPEPTIIGGIDLGTSFPIAPTRGARFFQLDWKRYISYLVTNESFAYSKDEQYIGKRLLTAIVSRYLEFLKESTNISPPIHPGPFQHYRIISEMHIVDVAAQEAPEISLLTSDEVELGVSQVCKVSFPRSAL